MFALIIMLRVFLKTLDRSSPFKLSHTAQKPILSGEWTQRIGRSRAAARDPRSTSATSVREIERTHTVKICSRTREREEKKKREREREKERHTRPCHREACAVFYF
ncbi:hypothetical protein PUN28_003508 [Cardiocondyla obscurior]|uniref:Secreted protein n=1 Tax=Cardiocondyla obscurior TaxID=286306 RepID=A0AAW2GL80_9HYME